MRSTTIKTLSTLFSIISMTCAVLAVLSLIAWLLPTAFGQLMDGLRRLTGNPDILFNAQRIARDPVIYAIAFTLVAMLSSWLSGKVYRF